MKLTPPFRAGRVDDAPLLAELVNYAGEGMPLYLWSGMAEDGETAWDVGRRRAARETGSFSYRNAVMIEHLGRASGALIGYGVPDEPDVIDEGTPAMFVPMIELENMVPNTWYVNVLAVTPGARGLGFGSRLLGLAEQIARDGGQVGMSLIVADKNVGARRLYARCGYDEVASRPIVKDDWICDSENWVLMTKSF